MSQTLFRVRRAEFGEGAEIFIAVRSPNGRLGIVQPVQVVMQEEEGCSGFQSPVLHVETVGELQSLMDQLWQIGLRPSDIGTAGHLAATQAHLNDMRKLVEKSLDVKL